MVILVPTAKAVPLATGGRLDWAYAAREETRRTATVEARIVE